MDFETAKATTDMNSEKLKHYISDEYKDEWDMVAKKSFCSVYTKKEDSSPFKMLKIVAEIKDCSALTVYNCLQDSEYRYKWDKNVLESRTICVIDEHNDIGYYQVKTPPPLKNRDFVTHRSWTCTNDVYIIHNHSVCHKAEPPRKNVIRAASYLTGYIMENMKGGACRVTYISHSNPGGNLPPWLLNKLITVTAPKIVKELIGACRKYESWKSKNDPDHMPWQWPHQITAPVIDWDDLEDCKTQSDVDEEVDDVKSGEITPEQIIDSIITDDERQE